MSNEELVPLSLISERCLTIGSTELKCPYCGAVIAKMPERLTVCKSCGKSYTSRSRPRDRVRVVVTTEEAAEIEGNYRTIGEFKDLAKYFEGPPESGPDRELWDTNPYGLFEKQARRDADASATKREWALYGCALRRLAHSLLGQERSLEALSLLLEKILLDISGATNCGRDSKYGEFHRSFANVPNEYGSDAINTVAEIVHGLGMTIAELEQAFLLAAARFNNMAGTSLKTSRAWGLIRKHVRLHTKHYLRDED